jgi:hypothetical protein
MLQSTQLLKHIGSQKQSLPENIKSLLLTVRPLQNYGVDTDKVSNLQ